MSAVPAFHSSKQKDVYHTCSTCTEGNNVEARYKTLGTGSLPKCSSCSKREGNGTC